MEEIAPELARTDFLVCCLPLTDETQGLVDAEFLAKLKPGAVLIDISRGGVVKGDAVVQALDAGILKGAALDVFEQQPLPAGSPLWKRPDVLITPHVSGTTPHYLERALQVFCCCLHDIESGAQVRNRVDINSGY